MSFGLQASAAREPLPPPPFSFSLRAATRKPICMELAKFTFQPRVRGAESPHDLLLLLSHLEASAACVAGLTMTSAQEAARCCMQFTGPVASETGPARRDGGETKKKRVGRGRTGRRRRRLDAVPHTPRPFMQNSYPRRHLQPMGNGYGELIGPAEGIKGPPRGRRAS